MTTAAPELRGWLESRRQTVEAALERWLPDRDAVPAGLREVMRYSLFAGGKRLRPMLVLAAAEAVATGSGLDEDDAVTLALPAACAVELIHTYSLVHDDLPAMDNDTLRRGRATAHVAFGEGLAILSGDGLLTEAFALLVREPAAAAQVPALELAARKLRAIGLIADAAGPAGMVGGQALDLEAAAAGAPPLDAAALQAMHRRKTGALIQGSACAGAVLAGATAPQLEAVRRYGEEIGLAFQIVDDILDVEGLSADLGKTAGKDAAAGKPTYPALFGLEHSRRLAADAIARALEVLAAARLEGRLPAIARWVVSRTH